VLQVPAAVAAGSVQAIAAGASHALALLEDGRVIAWGGNTNQQVTVPPSAARNISAIAAGDLTSFALKEKAALSPGECCLCASETHYIDTKSINSRSVMLMQVSVSGALLWKQQHKANRKQPHLVAH
jgi:alpha-tubulin suppressor-like RCC1 family protein